MNNELDNIKEEILDLVTKYYEVKKSSKKTFEVGDRIWNFG